MPQLTGSKERSLFAQLVKNYENKQFRKGLKAADQILRKVPDHGDTQAMKALIINSQGNSEEAFALAKIALRNDMKSHICWHVYGLLYRSIKNFEEAIKAYKFALRLEPESQQIQRDLALLQMQMRDYQGYIQSRRAILQARTALRQNWTALAVAQHLAGDLADAERTLTVCEETLKSQKVDLEVSEAILYKNTIIAEMGEIERALEHLDAVSKSNPDRTAVMEMRAQYLLKLGKTEEAANAYRALLSRNTENRSYYDGLLAALGLQVGDVSSLKSLFSEYAEKNSRGNTARRIPLDLFEGEDFREAADKYLQHLLHKGVPSTFANVKALYSNSSKRDIIVDLIEGYSNSSDSTDQINGSSEAHINGDTTSVFQASVRYFQAQHYNYHVSRDLGKAMIIIDECIVSKPESVDYHMTKARIWKHYGNTHAASEAMEKARTLDIRDRYINTKAAKYQLRNNENVTALSTMSKFTRNEAVGGPLGDLHDMQCVWYITEDGEAHIRQGNLGLALKRFTAIYNIFDIWQEDQFDFHTFSLRKGQIRAYVDMIRWEDHLRDHPYFSRAAIAAAKIYIRIYDQSQLRHEAQSNGVNGGVDTEASAGPKKAPKKPTKDQQKQEQIEAEKRDAKKTNATAPEGEAKKEDKDPNGEKLLQTSVPLTDAMKFINPLLEFSPQNIEAQAVGFEVFFRRKKYLLALRCLLASRSLNPSDPIAHEQAIRLRHTIDVSASSLPLRSKVSEVIESDFSSILPKGSDLLAYNADFLRTRATSAPRVHAFLRARHFLDPTSHTQNQNDLLQTLTFKSILLEDAINGLTLLKEWRADASTQDQYIAKAHDRWAEASAFSVSKSEEQ